MPKRGASARGSSPTIRYVKVIPPSALVTQKSEQSESFQTCPPGPPVLRCGVGLAFRRSKPLLRSRFAQAQIIGMIKESEAGILKSILSGNGPKVTSWAILKETSDHNVAWHDITRDPNARQITLDA